MSYQQVSPGGVVKKLMSKWWWIGLLIAWLIFVIAGAALIGVWVSNSTPHCSYDSYFEYICEDGNGLTGAYYAALACFGIGGILHLAYWIVLIVWCTKRRRVVETVPLTYTNAPPMEAGPDKPYSYPSTAYYPGPDGTSSPAPTLGRYCGHCGTPVTSQFCTQCGARP
jgi:hypothetical protein